MKLAKPNFEASRSLGFWSLGVWAWLWASFGPISGLLDMDLGHLRPISKDLGMDLGHLGPFSHFVPIWGVLGMDMDQF